MITFIYQTVYLLKVYNSVFLNIFTELCSHCHTRFQNIFITPERNCTRQQPLTVFFQSSFPQPLATSKLSASMDLHSLNSPCKWTHRICGLLYLALFTQYSIFKVHLCCISTLFLFIAKQYSRVWTYYNLFMHS